MTDTILQFDKLPDKVEVTTKELDLTVPHMLTIKEAKETVTTKGHLALELTYFVDNTKLEIRYDYCVIKMKDGTDCSYGQAKLKKILNAVNIVPTGKFTINTIAELIKGKSFMNKLEKSERNEKVYYALVQKLDDIKPVETTTDTHTLFDEMIEEANENEDKPLW